ncbi:MAG: polynucleotide kinase-phosphatase [Planctomycetota bacterium]|nr:MAG: polynucleotide kinase-phosphatase [Planctomycetota bacterium]REJ86978.1 MAG: polynucleotide kinase-phosphatase [Planctomycetota bacterium]REK24963.1 MAG: polynucleotide kinase-phosphatase [Planctomycetota bacterium]REK48550.1 MAG: polynucleotide kinase-phosphatase [Planctomycetota bacterium]
MNISIPKLSLVVLIGPSGSGKSTFAREHFLPTEVLSSDFCRGLVSDDENDQAATNDAFDVLHYVASKRLAAGRLTVVDATNVQREARQPLVKLAREYHTLPVAIVFDMPEDICQQRNRDRSDRDFGPHVIRQQRSQLRRSIKSLKREGFRHIFVLERPEEVDAVTVERVPLWNDKRDEHGPFDFIGDIHGCCDELEDLLVEMGYESRPTQDPGPGWSDICYAHPEGRKAAFVGDLVDRGPRVVDSLSLVRNMVTAGSAICVPGNHDMKLMRKLRGKNVQITHGLAESLAEIDAIEETQQEEFRKQLCGFLDSLVSHYVLDNGKVVVAHAGMKESMQGRGSGKVREFALYGETTGETDEFGLPVRYNWASEYRGNAIVVYGHTPVPEPDWLNKTINIDTGCVFGGALTALRYPELEFVSVKAKQTYCEPARPFLADGEKSPSLSTQHEHDDLLDIADVSGKRIISTRLRHNVTIREENGTAALEVMSRFAANPKWLVYLPPTMSPSETSTRTGYLEHPDEAFSYFRSQGVPKVVCEEKHMGSRAVVVICRDEDAATRRFGIEGETGIVFTRTGRQFFNDESLERAVLQRVREALSGSGFWEEFDTKWVVLDCELMPWSAKAQELLKSQYAAVGAAANAALPHVLQALGATNARLNGEEANSLRGLHTEFESRQESAQLFVDSYRNYCWPVESIDDFKLAPFHILATESRVHVQQNHQWHMETIADVCERDSKLLLATPFRVVDVTDPGEVEEATGWWNELTGRGGEGMVVKPFDFIAKVKKGLLQPAVKCRGREYLRIIYGPNYTHEDNLTRLRNRGLGAKRSLALREFALGIEALERFVRREPLRRVHECVFGVLALESEPVDPRL